MAKGRGAARACRGEKLPGGVLRGAGPRDRRRTRPDGPGAGHRGARPGRDLRIQRNSRAGPAVGRGEHRTGHQRPLPRPVPAGAGNAGRRHRRPRGLRGRERPRPGVDIAGQQPAAQPAGARRFQPRFGVGLRQRRQRQQLAAVEHGGRLRHRAGILLLPRATRRRLRLLQRRRRLLARAWGTRQPGRPPVPVPLDELHRALWAAIRRGRLGGCPVHPAGEHRPVREVPPLDRPRQPERARLQLRRRSAGVPHRRQRALPAPARAR